MAFKEKVILKVKGMHCASCANVIAKNLSKVEGVKEAASFYATEEAVLSYDDSKTNLKVMNKKLKPLGYELLEEEKIEAENQNHGNNHDHGAMLDLQKEKEQVDFAMPIALFVFVAMIWELVASKFKFIPVLPFPESFWMSIQFVLASIIFFILGQGFIRALATFIRFGKANMDTLVGLGTGAAYFYSVLGLFFPSLFARFGLTNALYFDVTIIVIAFVKFGKYLEARSKLRTGEALASLVKLQAKTALVKRNNNFVELAIEEVKVGDLIKIKPGSSIPVDGIVTDGESNIDEAMITGESLPLRKIIGDKVVAGTLNIDGVLFIKAQKIGSETVLAKIVEMVKNAQNSKAPIERLADQVSSIFVPTVLVIALLTLLAWVFLPGINLPFSQSFAFGISCMIAVLVIACPCALGLATPTAMIVGVGGAAKKGILIKNAESLEQLHRVTTVVFDKTGTLTTGKPSLERVISFSDYSEKEVLTLAAALENQSEHPLALAVVNEAKTQNLTLAKVEKFHNLAGEGVRGEIKNKAYWLVSEKFASTKHALPKEKEFIANPGESLLYLLDEKKILGVITVADQLKETTQEAIDKLKKLNIKLVMLSGDRQKTAEYFAKTLGIDEAIGEVKPEQKLAKIKELQAKGEIVAMVGDGVNDAPALAAANVGIAMSTGTEVAMSTAQATILRGDLLKVETAIALSKSVMRVVRQNLFWAFAYNVVGIPLAAGAFYPFFGVLLNPAFAGMAMAFSSVSVVANSLRLKLFVK